ncbi:MAG TPA: type II secretion system F family protein [Gemmatales bacterium]|nr:type II secretion system F family protein [Gemmatales bacterium]HMP59314.1 type II secretion system F family protein [Gemmatales bacterium]
METNDIVLLAALGVGLAAFGVMQWVLALRARRQERLEKRLLGRQATLPTALSLDLPVPPHEQPWNDRLDTFLSKLMNRTGLAASPQQVLGLALLSGLGIAGLLYLWRGSDFLAFSGLVVGMALPIAVILILQNRLRAQIQQQLPDAFFFLARALRAGLSFEQAMSLVAKESAEPLGPELKRCSEHLTLGLTPAAALQLASARIGLADFRVFCSMVALHTSSGGNLVQMLDRLAANTRDRNLYYGYFRSATSLGRTSAIAIGAAVPLLFISYALFEPEYAQRFFESGTGLAMLGVAFGLEIVGAVWLYQLLKAEY